MDWGQRNGKAPSKRGEVGERAAERDGWARGVGVGAVASDAGGRLGVEGAARRAPRGVPAGAERVSSAERRARARPRALARPMEAILFDPVGNTV